VSAQAAPANHTDISWRLLLLGMAGAALVAVAVAAWLVPRPAAQSAIPLFVAMGVVSALAAAGGALLRRDWPGHDHRPAGDGEGAEVMVEASQPDTVAPAELERLRRSARQKTALARSLAELLPRMPEALAWQVENALAEAGVRRVIPDGELFDAELHHAVGTEPVPTGGQADRVARTIRPGYSDEAGVLVYPKVVVYADDGDEADTANADRDER
jgi:hypothetical protein